MPATGDIDISLVSECGVPTNAHLEAYYNLVFRNHCSQETIKVAFEFFRKPMPLVIRPVLARDDACQTSSDPTRTALLDDLMCAMELIAEEASQCAQDVPRLIWLPSWQAWEVNRTLGQNWKSWGDLTQLLYRSQKTAECVVQELTSMLPVLLLDPQPHEAVCDLCAAPGSKTLQILEAMCRQESLDFAACKYGAVGLERGLLVANELDTHRASALASRLQCDSGHLAVHAITTSCNAALFPTLFLCDRIEEKRVDHDQCWKADAAISGDELKLDICYRYIYPADEWSNGEGTATNVTAKPHCSPWYQRRKLKFQRILADVPCSGDGTLRKNPDIWENWNTARGLGNFPRQLAILRRALELLQEGGRCVYSTCSMNPMEGEAVVAAAIRLHNATKAKQGGGWAFLEDAHGLIKQRLPGVPPHCFERGLRDWRVPSRCFTSESPEMFSSWDEVPASLRHKRTKVRAAEAVSEGDGGGVKLRPEMFPSLESESGESEHGVDTSCCVRVLPTEGVNSGGFFVAVLAKRSLADCDNVNQGRRKGERWQCWADCRFAFPRIKRKERESFALLGFFGLFADDHAASAHGVERFPFERVAWAPGRGQARGRDCLVLLPFSALRIQYHSDIKFLNGGLPLFQRMDFNCAWAKHAGLSAARDFFCWRPLPGAAATFLFSCATRRVLRLSLDLLCRLLRERRLPFAEIVGIPGLETCGSWGKQATDVTMEPLIPGGVLLVLATTSESREPAVRAFAGLLSRQELLILGSSDLRQRWLSLLDRQN